LAREEIARLSGNQLNLFGYKSDEIVEQAFLVLANSSIRTVGHELIFCRIYDCIGFSAIDGGTVQALGHSAVGFSLKQAENGRLPVSLSREKHQSG